MNNYRPQTFSILPPVVKNLLIINGILFLATYAAEYQFGTDLAKVLGLHYWQSSLFRPYQLITYMFMHGGFSHIFFNMFAVWMFGSVLERTWGSTKFLTYYMLTGIGAGLFNMLVTYIRIQMIGEVPPEMIQEVITKGPEYLSKGLNWTNEQMASLNILYNVTTVGASGSLYGLLLAFGMMFPNSLIYVYFAIPMKAKYFVVVFGLIELFSGVANMQGDNVAHFAHLGGMIFGFILIEYWKFTKKKKNNINHEIFR